LSFNQELGDADEVEALQGVERHINLQQRDDPRIAELVLWIGVEDLLQGGFGIKMADGLKVLESGDVLRGELFLPDMDRETADELAVEIKQTRPDDVIEAGCSEEDQELVRRIIHGTEFFEFFADGLGMHFGDCVEDFAVACRHLGADALSEQSGSEEESSRQHQEW